MCGVFLFLIKTYKSTLQVSKNADLSSHVDDIVYSSNGCRVIFREFSPSSLGLSAATYQQPELTTIFKVIRSPLSWLTFGGDRRCLSRTQPPKSLAATNLSSQLFASSFRSLSNSNLLLFCFHEYLQLSFSLAEQQLLKGARGIEGV